MSWNSTRESVNGIKGTIKGALKYKHMFVQDVKVSLTYIIDISYIDGLAENEDGKIELNLIWLDC